MTLIPAKNMSKKPFFRRKNERITNVFEGADHVPVAHDQHRPERSADVEARSAERSGYNYSLKHNRKDIQIWRARLNQSKPLTRTGFGR